MFKEELMEKFQEDVKKLLLYVGGKENIQAVSHCVTRMRFVLVKPELADVAAIESLPSAKGTFTQSGQFQVIIGNEVSEFYNAFTAYAGIEGVSKDSLKSSAKSNQTVLQRIMGALGEIFAPLIPALICGGLILGFRNIIGEIAMFDGQTLAQASQFWNGVYSFLWLIGEAVFHMLPVGIVWSITKKMGTTQILGIILGLTLVSPQLLNGFQVAGTEASAIPVWNFDFTQIQMIGYQGQVIAAMMAGFVLVYLEKLSGSHQHDCCAVLFTDPGSCYCSYSGWTCRLDNRKCNCGYCLYRTNLQLWRFVCRGIWADLCANRYDRLTSYDECN